MVMKLVVVMIVLVVVIVVVVLMVMVVSNDGEKMALVIQLITIFNIVTIVMYNLAMIANTFRTPLTTNILNIVIPYQGIW